MVRRLFTADSQLVAENIKTKLKAQVEETKGGGLPFLKSSLGDVSVVCEFVQCSMRHVSEHSAFNSRSWKPPLRGLHNGTG